MEHARVRTLCGIGLIVVGGVLLARMALAPIGPLGALMFADRSEVVSQQEAQREMQLAQQEAQRELQQAQREMQLAQQEAQRELQQQLRESSDVAADMAPLPELPALPPLPSIPEVPPLPPIPPEPTESHIDFWPSPALLLIAIGILLFWRRGQRDHVPRQA